MSNPKLEKAFNLIDENGGDFEGPKDEKLIALAEAQLGLLFPPAYRSFLARYGCGDIDGVEVCGIIGDDFENSGVPDAIWLTLEERKSGLPSEFILINSVGDGSYLAIDTSKKTEKNENPVVIFDDWENAEIVFQDFGSFLFAAVNGEN